MTKATILNTRPMGQLNSTHKTFCDAGFDVIDLPCIEVTTIDNPQSVINSLNKIQSSNIVVFTSQNAVRYAFKTYPQWAIPQLAIVIAVGKKTAEVLAQYCDSDILIPEEQNSNGVIALLKGFKNDQPIHLITAKGGRNQIQNYAKLSAISLTQINVYKRIIPQVDKTAIQLIDNTLPIYVLVSSVTTLINLQKLLPHSTWEFLQSQTLLCSSKRICNKAKEIGFNVLINVDTAHSETIAQKVSELID